MGKGKKKSRAKRKKKNKANAKTMQPVFAQAVLTQAQSRLFRTMHIAEQAILEPSDELHGIAIPSVN